MQPNWLNFTDNFIEIISANVVNQTISSEIPLVDGLAIVRLMMEVTDQEHATWIVQSRYFPWSYKMVWLPKLWAEVGGLYRIQ